MKEWLLNAKWTIFQIYGGIDALVVEYLLCTIPTFQYSSIFIFLAHCNISLTPWKDIKLHLVHIITILSQPVSALLNIVQKSKIPIL
jgi:hypothetical protein